MRSRCQMSIGIACTVPPSAHTASCFRNRSDGPARRPTPRESPQSDDLSASERRLHDSKNTSDSQAINPEYCPNLANFHTRPANNFKPEQEQKAPRYSIDQPVKSTAEWRRRISIPDNTMDRVRHIPDNTLEPTTGPAEVVIGLGSAGQKRIGTLTSALWGGSHTHRQGLIHTSRSTRRVIRSPASCY
jgi:hypothetical protein